MSAVSAEDSVIHVPNSVKFIEETQGVAVAPWTHCIIPCTEFNVAEARRRGCVGLVELDGVAPKVQNNLRGPLLRGEPFASLGCLAGTEPIPNRGLRAPIIEHSWRRLFSLYRSRFLRSLLS